MGPVGVILAGGAARRMGGGDKPLLTLGGRPILDHVLDRVRPQVSTLALSANGDPARFAAWDLPAIADPIDGFAGPLAGILAGIEWAASAHPEAGALLSVSADTPFLPRDLVDRLEAARRQAGAAIAMAASGGRIHPTMAIWPLALSADLRHALVSEGVRKVETYARRHGIAVAEFAAKPFDPFLNINTPQDLAEAERLVGSAR